MSRNKNDAYYTPPPLTRALIDRLPKTGYLDVAEPCAGDGWIERILEDKGYKTTSGDIEESRPVDHPGVDVFSCKAGRIYRDCGAVITNPPFTAAPRFVRRFMEFSERVVCLLRISFWEPCEDREESARADLVQDLSHVIVLPRYSFYRGDEGTDSATCCWFIWEKGNTNTTAEVVTKTEMEEYRVQESLLEDPYGDDAKDEEGGEAPPSFEQMPIV